MDFTGADLPPAQAKEQRKKLLRLALDIKDRLKDRKDPFSDQVIAKEMLDMSKCPDYVINKGHYFGTDYFTEEPGLVDAEGGGHLAVLGRRTDQATEARPRQQQPERHVQGVRDAQTREAGADQHQDQPLGALDDADVGGQPHAFGARFDV